MIRKYKTTSKEEVRAPNAVAAWKNSGGAFFRKTKEEDTSEALARYKRLTQEAQEEYKKAGESLQKATDERLRRAAVDYELLKKYLPLQNEQAGLTGLGVSESASIEARNGYLGRVGTIESEGAEAKAELDRAYREEKKALDKEYKEERQKEQEAIRKNLKESQDFAYESAMEMLKEERFSEFEELDLLLEQMKPRVRSDQYEQILNYVNYYKSHPDYIARDRMIKEEQQTNRGR